MKGSKRDRWLKDGIHTTRKYFKNIWNRRARHFKDLPNGNAYKKLSGVSAYTYVS